MNEQLQVIEKNEYEQVIEMFSQIEKKFERELKEKHGIANDPPHPYHGLRHSKFVRERSLAIFDEIKNATPWVLLDMDKSEYENLVMTDIGGGEARIKVQRAYISMLVMGHDIVQNGFIRPDGIFARFRGVMPGQNEYESAARIINEIAEASKNNPKLRDYIAKLNISRDRVFCDINATFPEFDPKAALPYSGNEALKITQPYLFDASMAGKIIALCDLYAPYSGSDLASEYWSDAEFWETHPNLIKVAQNIDRGEVADLRDPKICQLLSDVESWVGRQEGFIKWLNHTFASNINKLKEVEDGQYREAAAIIAQAMPVKRYRLHARLAADRKAIVEEFISGIRQQGMVQLKEKLRMLLVAMNYYDLDLDKVRNSVD